MPLSVGVERWPLASPFAISRGAKTEAVTITALIGEPVGRKGGPVGRGEATPYARYGEEPNACADLIEAQRGWVDDASLTPASRRDRLLEAMAPGAARNALDCALWDLEAKRSGASVAALAGLTPPASVTTAFTLGLGAPEAMGAAAAAAVAARRGD
ncbi:MAG: dipeptide epimerase, partial [Pseudomonadota bacterium]